MGHANVSTTIDVYGGDFDRQRDRRPGDPMPDYGALLGNAMETTPRSRPQLNFAEVASASGLSN